MRQAWLIIAHNEFGILQRLISMLDEERSDFYIHIDKKVRSFPSLNVEKGRLFLLEDRMDVRWGSVSQIAVEILLLKTALDNSPYAHYHIISGTHLPLCPVGELMGFYDAHPEESVARFWPKDEGDADFKLRRYHFPLGHYKYGSPFQRRLCQRGWQVVIKVQKILGIRHLRGERFVKTDNWLSLSEPACHFLVERSEAILKKYRWSFCGDEYFAASELVRAGMPLFDCSRLLYVEFQGDTPRTFPMTNLPQLRQTGYLWARKFSSYDH